VCYDAQSRVPINIVLVTSGANRDYAGFKTRRSCIL